jgi:O-antigen/teichoic acid export membrane protein
MLSHVRSPVFIGLVAGVVGRASTSAAVLLLIPVFIATVGVEGYGLIYLYLTFLSVSASFDFGFSTTLGREFARLRAVPDGGPQARRILHSLEAMQAGLGVVLGLLVALSSEWIATHWLHLSALPTNVAANCLALTGASISAHMLALLYAAGLTGMERQGAANIITSGGVLLQLVGGAVALVLFPADIEVFFWWQFVGKLLQATLGGVVLRQTLPAARGWSFDAGELRRLAAFSAPMAGSSLLTLVIFQADNFILSKILSFEQFSIYGLAKTLAQGLTLVGIPIYQVALPRLTLLLSQGDEVRLVSTFRRFSGLCGIATATVAAPLALFSGSALLVSTGNLETSRSAAGVMSMLTVAAAANCLYVVPFSLGLAEGRARFFFVQNLFSCAFLVPVVYLGAKFHGAAGGAAAQVLMFLGWVLIAFPVLIKRSARRLMVEWYANSLLPMLTACLAVGLYFWIIPEPVTRPMALIVLAGAGLVALIGAAVGSPEVWRALKQHLSIGLGR